MMRALRAYLLIVAVAALVAACGGGGDGGGGGGGGGGGAGLPPVGVVWFGSGFEEGSLSVMNQTTSIAAGSPIVAVGRFLATKDPGDMTVHILRLGSTVARVPLPDGPPGNAFGIDLTGQNLPPGNYLVNFVDNNRRTHAAGNLTITQ